MDEPMLRVWMQESVPPTTQYGYRPGRWVAEPAWPSANITTRQLPLAPGRLLDAGASPPEAALPIQSPLTLGLFAGKWCSYAAGHKEINRTTLTSEMIDAGLQKAVVLDQLEMMRLRNTAEAFNGTLRIANTSVNELEMTWSHQDDKITLSANLQSMAFTISYTPSGSQAQLYSYPKP
jgi:predicted acyl esterase